MMCHVSFPIGLTPILGVIIRNVGEDEASKMKVIPLIQKQSGPEKISTHRTWVPWYSASSWPPATQPVARATGSRAWPASPHWLRGPWIPGAAETEGRTLRLQWLPPQGPPAATFAPWDGRLFLDTLTGARVWNGNAASHKGTASRENRGNFWGPKIALCTCFISAFHVTMQLANGPVILGIPTLQNTGIFDRLGWHCSWPRPGSAPKAQRLGMSTRWCPPVMSWFITTIN